MGADRNLEGRRHPARGGVARYRRGFERYEKRPSKRKVNSLAYCAQEVLAAAEEMKEAAVGAPGNEKPKAKPAGFQSAEIVAFLRRNAGLLLTAKLPERPGISGAARGARRPPPRCVNWPPRWRIPAPRLEDLERRLTVLEEKLFAVLLAATPDDEIVAVRAEADRELAPTGARCRRRRLINCRSSICTSDCWRSMACRD